MSEDPNDRVVPVTVKNWSDQSAKPRYAKKTTVKTWVLDAAGAAGPTFIQISDYEPKRLRLVVETVDNPVTISVEPPVKSPDTSSATVAPQGRHLGTASTSPVHEFFGPDAFWINSINATTRVTVTKEYSE